MCIRDRPGGERHLGQPPGLGGLDIEGASQAGEVADAEGPRAKHSRRQGRPEVTELIEQAQQVTRTGPGHPVGHGRIDLSVGQRRGCLLYTSRCV